MLLAGSTATQLYQVLCCPQYLTSEWHTVCKRNSCYTAVHKNVTIYFGHLWQQRLCQILVNLNTFCTFLTRQRFLIMCSQVWSFVSSRRQNARMLHCSYAVKT